MYFFSVALLIVYDGESDVIGTFGQNSIPKGNYVSSRNRVSIFFGTIWNHYEVNCFDFKLEYLPHSKKLYQIRREIFFSHTACQYYFNYNFELASTQSFMLVKNLPYST